MIAGRRPRILFVAEAVTLAHVARPLALAESLDPARYEVIFASEPRFGQPRPGLPFAHRAIRSIPTEPFLAALARGAPIYDFATLEAYEAEDRRLIEETRPDAVVGDCRISLQVSARLAGVPYLAITNAYWSPFAPGALPMPDLPMSRILGVPLASLAFRASLPIGLALHARGFNRFRRRHGLPGLGPDLRRIYTDGDRTLYADVPELAPTANLPATQHYLGPILWSPEVPLPPWWHDLPDDRPIVYATPGSSGRPGLLEAIYKAVEGMPLTVIAASAARGESGRIPSNVRVAAYLPGQLAASRSSLVISNGGSPTSYQALAAGAPVLGLAGNMDQHLSMRGVVARGAGLIARTERASPASIRRGIERILADLTFREAASAMAATLARYDAPSRFRAILDEVLEPAGTIKAG